MAARKQLPHHRLAGFHPAFSGLNMDAGRGVVGGCGVYCAQLSDADPSYVAIFEYLFLFFALHGISYSGICQICTDGLAWC